VLYVDHNATAPILPAVRDAIEPLLGEAFANPSSPYGAARRVRERLEEARAQVASSVGAAPSEVVFVSGGTEAIEAALWGVAMGGEAERPHIVTARDEHTATLSVARWLAERGVAELTEIPVDADGHWTPADVLEALRPHTRIVSLMHANNETGVLHPIAEVARALGGRATLHVDAVQTWGKIPLDVNQLGCDLLSLSAHKIGGLKGTGALVVRGGTRLEPLIRGGLQERGRRGGTENAVGIVAMGCAASHLPERLRQAPAIRALRNRLEAGCLTQGDARINGTEPRVGNTVNVEFAGVDAESLLIRLDLAGICASSASACTTGTARPSHVLTAMGRTPAEAMGAVRFSLGPEHTDQDVDRLLEALREAVPLARE
jgi:cysteine desulfurase